MNIENHKIIHSNNIGNCYTTNNFYYEKITAESLIKKANICLKNKNYNGAYKYFLMALEEEMNEEDIYYCYKSLIRLTSNLNEKAIYLNNIFKLNIKKSKKDIIQYIVLEIMSFIDENRTLCFLLLFIAVIRIISFLD